MAHLYKVNSIDDFEDYFKIKSDKTAVLWSGFSCPPDKEKLRVHFNKLLTENFPKGDILVYLKDDETNALIGYDLLTKLDDETVESSGHSILSEWQGKGYGTLLFKLLVDYTRKIGYKKFTGWISEKNIGSIKNVEKNGFVRTEEWRMGKLAAFDREDKYYKYLCIL